MTEDGFSDKNILLGSIWINTGDVFPRELRLATDSRGRDALQWINDGWPSSIPVKGNLRTFASLADASNETILNFARTRGVLGILPEIEIISDKERMYTESLDHYRHLARLVKAILNAIKRRHDKEPFHADSRRFYPNLWDFKILQQDHLKALKTLDAQPTEQGRDLVRRIHPYWLLANSLRRWWDAADINMVMSQWKILDLRPGIDLVDFSQRNRWENDILQEGNNHRFYRYYQPAPGCQRSSALFGLLAIQMFQAYKLHDSSLFCAHCGIPIEGRDRHTRNGVAWCDNGICETAYKQNQQHRYHLKRQSKKRRQVAYDESAMVPLEG